MASISTSIELVDRVSGRLAAIEAGALALSATFDQLGGVIDAAAAGLANFGGENMPEGSRLEIEARIVPKLDTAAMESGQADIGARLQAMLDAATAAWKGDGMERLGRQIPERIADGMDAGSGSLASRVQEMSASALQAASEAMSAAKARSVGLDFSSGLAAGIRAGRSGVVSAATAVANAAANAARTALDIHSPSRVMEEAGGYFGKGFSIGIEDSATAVQRAAARLADCARLATEQAAAGKDICKSVVIERSLLGLDDGETLQRVRETAQVSGVNRFTTAQVHVDFTANNQIDSRMDLDEVLAYLEQQLAERLAMAAEGVYG